MQEEFIGKDAFTFLQPYQSCIKLLLMQIQHLLLLVLHIKIFQMPKQGLLLRNSHRKCNVFVIEVSTDCLVNKTTVKFEFL